MKLNFFSHVILSIKARWLTQENPWTFMVSFEEGALRLVLAVPFLCAFFITLSGVGAAWCANRVGLEYGWTVSGEGGRLSWRHDALDEEVSPGWGVGFLWSDMRGKPLNHLRELTIKQLTGHVPIVGGWPDHMFLALVTSKRIVTTYANPLCRAKTLLLHDLQIDHPPSVPNGAGGYAGIERYSVVADSAEDALARYVSMVVDERRKVKNTQAQRQAVC